MFSISTILELFLKQFAKCCLILNYRKTMKAFDKFQTRIDKRNKLFRLKAYEISTIKIYVCKNKNHVNTTKIQIYDVKSHYLCCFWVLVFSFLLILNNINTGHFALKIVTNKRQLN